MYCLMFLAGLLIGFWCCYVRTLERIKYYSEIIQNLEKLSRIDKFRIDMFKRKVLSNCIPRAPPDAL